MNDMITFTKTVRKYADAGYCITIPREICNHYDIRKGDLVEITMRIVPKRRRLVR